MTEDMFYKNAESARKICDIMGYRLVGFDPDWAIAMVEEKLPTNMLELMSNQMLGRYDAIPDEFMGRIALLMGFDWEFPIPEDQLKIFISQCDERVKEVEKNMKLRIEFLEKIIEGENDNTIKENVEAIKKDSDEYLNEIKTECEQKIKSFESMIQLRERLRKWNVSN